jgi:hypothetical protein
MVRLAADGDERPADDVGPGMYAPPDTENAALAEGLRKILRNKTGEAR